MKVSESAKISSINSLEAELGPVAVLLMSEVPSSSFRPLVWREVVRAVVLVPLNDFLKAAKEFALAALLRSWVRFQ